MFNIENHGSIALIRPMDEAAREHAIEVYDEGMWFGGAVVCEPRFVPDNVESILADGFRVFCNGIEIVAVEESV